MAQGFAPTSVREGDVGTGVDAARSDLVRNFGKLAGEPEIFVNSSAAGGLRMTVHGLTASMTARAAREASLGAGAIVKMVSAGGLDEDDLDEIRSIAPNIILLAGGVDFGEKTVVFRNAERLASLGLSIPVVYAGNAAIRRQVIRTFESAGMEIIIADNVFPDVDVLNVDPLRKIIQELFGKHIVKAPGMERLESLSRHGILPTPGAVLRAAELFAEVAGDCLVFDVGGATTDVHSVTSGSPEYAPKATEPEPRAKRTVEGDLGVFVNAENILRLAREERSGWGGSAEAESREANLKDLAALPSNDREKELTRWLCARAVDTGARRHAGKITDLYTPTGRKQIVRGKDLTAVQWVIATGGALTRVPGAAECLRSICTGAREYLLPKPDARILVDRDYRFSALGTIAQSHPEAVMKTFARWVETERGGTR